MQGRVRIVCSSLHSFSFHSILIAIRFIQEINEGQYNINKANSNLSLRVRLTFVPGCSSVLSVKSSLS